MRNRTPLSQNARTHGLWRTARASSIDEKGFIYIPKPTSAPPRAGTTGIVHPQASFLTWVYTSKIANNNKTCGNCECPSAFRFFPVNFQRNQVLDLPQMNFVQAGIGQGCPRRQ